MPDKSLTEDDLIAKANECLRYAGKPESTAGPAEVSLLALAQTSPGP